ncbi:MAG: helicase-exonuclease AddAB subunit AddB [Butyrivibrio sp.]|nr:helicase-exonuclease AddAB subunit AddB [Butyrivibrio sp.]
MLRFCFGASGAGKSTGLYKEIIERSMKERETDFLILVPDQFTMQTQKDVVKMHPLGAIMNIDILSFGRLSHRVFEETGHSSFSVLDDLGKSLVLRRISDKLGDRLPIIGKNMHKPGYIDEVKSTISEFMQYGIGDEDLALLEEKSLSKGALCAKLKDLRLLYREFLDYINGKFTTPEETLDILCRALPDSELIKDSVVVFDGFTGFTPIQYRVIRQLLALCKEVIFTVTISPEEDPYSDKLKEQELFLLSKKTVLELEKLEFSVMREKGSNISDFAAFRALRHSQTGAMADIFIRETPVARLKDNPPLAYLEQSLFRYKTEKFEGENDSITIFRASTGDEEIRQAMIMINRLVKQQGYAYRDIALLCGSLDSYADIVTRQAQKFDIPIYVDKNTSILLNPFIEYITSAINIVISGYRYEDVFHYMRSGMTDFERDDADILEDYVRALGVRGRKQWEDRFLRHMPRRYGKRAGKEEEDLREVQLLEKLNSIRQKLSGDLMPLFDTKEKTVSGITDALIKVIEAGECDRKLQEYKAMFEELGDLKKAREYDQIYDKIMTLLQQMKSLVGDEVITLEEYRDLLSAGCGEIAVGTIPQDVDRIVVGDIERTRLREIKVLFFVGVNDGNIPSNAGSGGILSDIDRQFLLDLGTQIEFAPTPRQQMYIQRLYLYMNLTKPTDKLFLSFAELGSDGKSLHAAYLIPKITGMYENLEIKRPEDQDALSQVVSTDDGMVAMAGMIREYAAGRATDEEKKEFMTLYKVLGQMGDLKLLEDITGAAFTHYRNRPLAKAIATALYGVNLENSVTRLEQYASCAYAHFLKYGLGLEERAEYKFDQADLGNVFHDVLEMYLKEITSGGRNFRSITKEESDKILDEVVNKCVDSYGENILRSTSRNEYVADRIHKILIKTADTMRYQLSKGSFEPAHMEMSFEEAGNIEDINIALREDEKHAITESMKLKGRIDRVDICSDPDHVYVKIVDYKSSKHSFSVASLYYGLQLQLVLYMNVAMASEKKKAKGKEVVPAALLYYHIHNPEFESEEEPDEETLNQAIRRELNTRGLVSENRDIINLLDNEISGRSDVIPVEITSKGSLGARSQTAAPEVIEGLSEYVGRKIRQQGRNILDGDIEVNPFEDKKYNSCTFCDFKSICGCDEKVPGYRKRHFEVSDDEATALIMAEVKNTPDDPDRDEEDPDGAIS